MSDDNKFRTQKGYELKNNNVITRSMEDYIEMIYRYTKGNEVERVSNIAKNLNVNASSASKMISNLKKLGIVEFEKYGFVKLTDYGIELGEYYLYRHDILNRFFCLINNSENELEQVEQIEHFINKDTVKNIEKISHIIKQFKDK